MIPDLPDYSATARLSVAGARHCNNFSFRHIWGLDDERHGQCGDRMDAAVMLLMTCQPCPTLRSQSEIGAADVNGRFDAEVIEMIVDPGLGPLAPDVTEVDGKQMAEQMFEIIRSRLKFFG